MKVARELIPFDHLRALQLTGMLKALQDQEQLPDIERLGGR
jgi:hypothetical protein